MRNVCGCRGTSVSSRFSVNPSIHSGKSSSIIGLPRLHLCPSFYWYDFGLLNRASFLVPDRPLRSVAGLDDVLDESCGSDVEDELVPEFDDNPWTTRGTKIFRLAENLLPLFGQVWLLTAGPLTGKPMIFAELSKWWNCRRIFEQLQCHEEIKIVNILLVLPR